MTKQNILVIKHGSLGDWILATGAFKLIRKAHRQANIIMLTQSLYAPLARDSKWFDEIIIDDRTPYYKLLPNFKIIKKLRHYKYDHVYDLQCSSRTNFYHFFLKSKTQNWHGRAKGCSHFVAFDPAAHSVELARDIISSAGINEMPSPDINFLQATIKSFSPFVLFTPGCSAKHLYKRWTPKGYAKIIDWLASKKINSVLIGTAIDKETIDNILEESSSTPINLMSKTNFEEIAQLARTAKLIIGSDTGTMHLAAATGSPCLALFSKFSNPQKSRPWGDKVTVLQEKNLEDLSSDIVLSKLDQILKAPASIK